MTHESLPKGIDQEASVDAEAMDDLVARVVHPLAIAYERSEDLGATFRNLMADELRLFLGTHKSIRLLLKSHKENPSALADAMSLTREQVEKVFAVAILLEDPESWTLRYLKDDWRRHYERHLLDLDERSGLEGYKSFLAGYAAQSIERERVELGISETEKEYVALKYRNDPKAKASPELKRASKSVDYFPTPGGILKEISDDHIRGVLRRWIREYGYFSGYSHAMFRKLMPAHIDRQSKLTTTQKEKVVETEYAQSVWVSYLTIASACALAASKELHRAGGGYRAVGDVELLVRLAELWERMREGALLGQALWAAGANKLVIHTLELS